VVRKLGQGQLADFVPSLWYGREGAGHQSEPDVQLEVDDIKSPVKAALQSTFEAAEAALFPASSEKYQDIYA